MTSRPLNLRKLLLSVFVAFTASTAFADTNSWPGFRGTGDSIATVPTLPLKWDDQQNIAWSRELPGYGQSSPVVWEGRAFVTTVIGANKEKLGVVCINIQDGTIAWSKEFASSQPAKSTDYISRAAPTPVVDADRVYAFFESGDFLALTHAGETVWNRSLTKDYGVFQGNHGIGSSPAQSANELFVLIDHSGPSYLLAVEKKTGKTIWKKDRPSRVSWSSPILVTGLAGAELLVSSNGVAQSYRASDGATLWEVADLKGNTVASPTASAAGVLIGSNQAGQNLLIRRTLDGTTPTPELDKGASRIAWRATAASSSFGSPLIHRGRAYLINKSGVAFALDIANGKLLWTQRMPDSTWASPVGHDDRVYFFCKNGVTVVVRAGDTFEQMAENKLTVKGRLYGVAAAPGCWLLRSGDHLICVRESSPASR